MFIHSSKIAYQSGVFDFPYQDPVFNASKRRLHNQKEQIGILTGFKGNIIAS